MTSAGGTVLVVDDDQSIRLLCRVNLELEGLRVLEAGSTSQARELLRDEEVDVLLLDVHIGEEDGCAFLKTLRAEGSPIRVALLTGSVDLEEAARCLADCVIPKPFPLDELTQRVRELAGPGARAVV